MKSCKEAFVLNQAVLICFLSFCPIILHPFYFYFLLIHLLITANKTKTSSFRKKGVKSALVNKVNILKISVTEAFVVYSHKHSDLPWNKAREDLNTSERNSELWAARTPLYQPQPNVRNLLTHPDSQAEMSLTPVQCTLDKRRTIMVSFQGKTIEDQTDEMSCSIQFYGCRLW